jgi:hypothetical protein
MNYQEKYLKYKKKYLELKKKMVGGAIIGNKVEDKLRRLVLIRTRINHNIKPYVEANLQNIYNAIYIYGQYPPIAEFPIKPEDPLQFNMDLDWRTKLETYIMQNYIRFFEANIDGRDFREQLKGNGLLLMRRLTKDIFKTQQIILVDYENYFIRYNTQYGGTEDDALINLINKLGKSDNHINIICKRELTLTRFNLMINELKHNNYSISCIFTETVNGFDTQVYPKSTRSFDDCTFILIFKYLLPMFPNTIYFSDDKRLFTDFNTERRLLLPYNITIISTLNPYIINKAIINPIEDEFYNTDLTQAQLHDYNDPVRGFLNDGLIY